MKSVALGILRNFVELSKDIYASKRELLVAYPSFAITVVPSAAYSFIRSVFRGARGGNEPLELSYREHNAAQSAFDKRHEKGYSFLKTGFHASRSASYLFGETLAAPVFYSERLLGGGLRGIRKIFGGKREVVPSERSVNTPGPDKGYSEVLQEALFAASERGISPSEFLRRTQEDINKLVETVAQGEGILTRLKEEEEGRTRTRVGFYREKIGSLQHAIRSYAGSRNALEIDLTNTERLYTRGSEQYRTVNARLANFPASELERMGRELESTQEENIREENRLEGIGKLVAEQTKINTDTSAVLDEKRRLVGDFEKALSQYTPKNRFAGLAQREEEIRSRNDGLGKRARDLGISL